MFQELNRLIAVNGYLPHGYCISWSEPLLRADPRTRLLPVVILTSSDEDTDRMRSYENGANSFVRKPLDFSEFAETVARLGIYWLATNRPPHG
ncbi:MAG: hypothetical protein PHU46_11485 [Rhodocyclaceae bacterium]|nr:hypothetical protein [Rhodocyclaceae bacterium]